MIKRVVLKELQSIVGEKHCQELLEDRIVYPTDCFTRKEPEVTIEPGGLSEVVDVVKLASRKGIPINPRGAGPELNGMCVPAKGGIVLSMRRMNQILEVDERDRVGVVEPGVVTFDFQQEVKKKSLFYPPDPTGQMSCTLGGNVASNTGWPRAVKYGGTRDYVLGLEVVLASGEILKTGGRQMKNVTGYDLTRFFCGSEGTLGVITNIILKVLPRPESRKTLLVGFRRLEDAAEVVAKMMGSKILPASLEIMDNNFIRTAGECFHFDLPLDADGLLMIDVDGFEDSVASQAKRVERICLEHNPLHIHVASNEEESDQLWMARRLGIIEIHKKYKYIASENATVPISRIPTMIRRGGALAEKYGITIIISGHAGDRNLHTCFCFDPEKEEEAKGFQKAAAETFRVIIELGGTLNGKHSIGLGKKELLSPEINPAAKRVMGDIKKGLDPGGILNPGKFG